MLHYVSYISNIFVPLVYNYNLTGLQFCFTCVSNTLAHPQTGKLEVVKNCNNLYI